MQGDQKQAVKKLMHGLTKEQLEYRALMFSTNMWKRLADLLHLNPSVDFAVDFAEIFSAIQVVDKNAQNFASIWGPKGPKYWQNFEHFCQQFVEKFKKSSNREINRPNRSNPIKPLGYG